jgi:hypothetical protein
MITFGQRRRRHPLPQFITAMRIRGLLVGLVVMASVATACQYDPTLFAANPALSECFGTPATIGIGWFEPVDGPNGSSYVGTEGNDAVVITNGPVSFDGLGGNDRICVNDTGLASGAAPIVIDAGAGTDTVQVVGSGPVSVVVDLGEGDDFYGGVSAGDETVDAGPGEDHVTIFPGGGPTMSIAGMTTTPTHSATMSTR